MLPENLYQTAARCHLLMNEEMLDASRRVLDALSVFGRRSPARTGDESLASTALESQAVAKRTRVEDASEALLALMQRQLGVGTQPPGQRRRLKLTA